MVITRTDQRLEEHPNFPDNIPMDFSKDEERNFLDVVSTDLDAIQISRVVNTPVTFPRERVVMAIHWHPEFVPMNLIKQRFDSTFPNQTDELVIPTQHNEITTFDNEYYGTEIDAYSSGFNQKVQLLVHFSADKLEKASVLDSMCAHTFKYRASQLFDFIHTIIDPNENLINIAAAETGADSRLIKFVRIQVKKINDMIELHYDSIPRQSIKNKVLRNYFDTLRITYSPHLISRAQTFMQAVKRTVKQNFDMKYFYRTEELIEEARSIGAGIVIPHPEQFWPILLADYDVDGIEVWNPQSQRYTDFLISVIDQKNKTLSSTQRRILIFMGDDTHMGEKVRDPLEQDKLKANREIGVQAAWDDLSIRKKLCLAEMDKLDVINEYRERLKT